MFFQQLDIRHHHAAIKRLALRRDAAQLIVKIDWGRVDASLLEYLTGVHGDASCSTPSKPC